MRRLLDQLGFKKNRYARPNQDWICGRTDEGRPCPLGPDEKGRCRHTGECFPGKTGDRWHCTRREAHGGACPEGPLPNGACSHPIPPCQPQPSLRRTRGQFAWILVALTVGALLVVLAGQSRRRWIDPGELTVHHATSGTDCEDCHTPEKPGSLAALGLFQKHSEGDSQLCLKCHSLGEQPFAAHGAPAPALAAFTARAKDVKSNPSFFLRASTAVTNTNLVKSGQLACSTCHQEHHGKDFNIARLSEQQCQVCHSVQFASLENGHPEFASYPYQRRTRIYFDHASHLQEHFPAAKEKAPTSCQACHVPAVAGGKMAVNNFQQSCAACHTDNIDKSRPVAFLRVPGIDLGALAKAGISIGQWPKDADDKITPFMELLLGADTPGGQALAALKGKDLLDLRSASPEQLAAAGKLAWAVKELLFDFEVEGQPFLLKRLQEGLSPGQNATQLAALIGGIPRAGLIAARKEWMPDLLREIPDYRRGILPPPAAAPPAPPPATPAPAEKTKPASSDSDILGDTEPAAGPSPPGKSAEAAPPGDDILGDSAPASPSPSPSPPPPPSKRRHQRKTVTQPPPVSPPPKAVLQPEPKTVVQPEPKIEPAADETWMSVGGWYRQKDGFTFSYRPTGHADPFLVAWLNITAAAPSGASGVLQDLTSPTGAGSCAKCHSVDGDQNGRSRVNWAAARSEPNEHPFTKFSHTAHLSVMTEKGCQTCHVLNPASKYSTYFQPADPANPAGANRDPSHFESNFTSLPKMECAKCHTARIAGDNCLLCHNYHTGSFATDMSRAARFHPIASQPSK
jgi:cytochrome c553